MIITNPFDYTNAVSDTEDLSMSEKMVALTIARHFNWSEQNPAFPTNETIAKKAGCNPRTVIRAKATLIEKGWLSSKRRFNKSNYYTPSIPSDTMSLPIRHDVTSRGDTEYTLTNKITNNLTDNISSSAAWESEDISSQEEEKVLLETRGTSSIPLDYLKYLSLDYTFNDVRHLVEDPTLRKAILDKRREEGIF